MKRWNVTNSKGYTFKLYYETLEEVQKEWKDCTITECTDYEYLQYIQKIKDLSIETKQIYKSGRLRELLKIPYLNGFMYIILFKDNNCYYELLEYQVINNNALDFPITWTCISDIPKFYNEVLTRKPINIKLYSFRSYGEPKLPKPKELKNIKQSFSVDFIPKKCRCQCFIKDNDLYIKHRDYFSRVIGDEYGESLLATCKRFGIETNKKEKFLYADTWGSIVLRNEAWILIENIVPIMTMEETNEIELREELIYKFEKLNKIRRYDLGTTWRIFFENVVKELKEYLK